MDRPDLNRHMAMFGLYRPKRLLRAEMRRKKRRQLYQAYMASLFAIVTCLTISVSTTWAWFYANIKANESVIRVASFGANAKLRPVTDIEPTVIVIDAETAAEERAASEIPVQTYSLRAPAIPAVEPAPMVITEEELDAALEIPDGAYAAGTYEMDIDYSGTTGGYCAFTVSPASFLSMTAEPMTYYVRLDSTDGTKQTATVSLTLNEPAYVDVYSDWGEPAEGFAEFVGEEGVSFGEVLVIKVIGGSTGDTVYNIEDDTVIIDGVVSGDNGIQDDVGSADDPVYSVEDDTVVIGGVQDDTGTSGDTVSDSVYNVEDDTVILGGGDAGFEPEPEADADLKPEAENDDPVYSVADDTTPMYIPSTKREDAE